MSPPEHMLRHFSTKNVNRVSEIMDFHFFRMREVWKQSDRKYSRHLAPVTELAGSWLSCLDVCPSQHAYQLKTTNHGACSLQLKVLTRQCSLPWFSQWPVLPVLMILCSWFVFTQIISSTRSYPQSFRHSRPSSMALECYATHITRSHQYVLYIWSETAESSWQHRHLMYVGSAEYIS
jgi:hypothetical protein